MQIILLPFFAPCPGTAAKDGAPVRRRCAVRLSVTPDVPVAVFTIPGTGRIHKPRVLIRGMVIYQIHYDTYIPAPRLSDKPFHIGHAAISRVNAREIRDIITVIHHGRGVYRRQPDSPRPQFLQVVQFSRDTVQVTCAAARGIKETLGIYLIDIGFLPPFQVTHSYLYSLLPDSQPLKYQHRRFPDSHRGVLMFLHLRIITGVSHSHNHRCLVPGGLDDLLVKFQQRCASLDLVTSLD